MSDSQFKEKLRNLIKNVENNEIIEEDYYEWKIENFSNIQNHKSSPEFEILNHKWKIEINVCKEGIINLKLKSMDALYLSANKFIYANCVFTIRNNNDFSCYKEERLPTYMESISIQQTTQNQYQYQNQNNVTSQPPLNNYSQFPTNNYSNNNNI
ncbi:hypothetical protein LY90DRAFT_511342 [Neocallimastix californiae]|uniref:MATH domain-containing protein n=1 Tax=Neocallimastix californiae TaxID=1754190 RepID=A0A1Y2BQX9_9FUNG|nr:hypothetical protein LY90DRAFT_511342 [Neocallimastix californiae]|eukprot:ORY37152.1 hypothetical protein LY90DRAFT_511342 [Neocallimastix californiae]